MTHRGAATRGTASLELDRSRAAFEGELFGRDRELEQIRAALRGLHRGEPAQLLIVGEAGIGKSRLFAEALAGPQLDGVTVYVGRAREFEDERPFGVLVDALGLHSSSVDPTRAAIGRLVMRARDPRRTGERHDIVLQIVKLVGRLCGAGPVVLLLEDMQWADKVSVAAVHRLLEASGSRRLGIFMSRRALPVNPAVDDLVDRLRPGLRRIELAPIESDAADQLVKDLVGGAPGPSLTDLVAGAAGNPALVVALISGLRQERSLRVTRGVAETDAAQPPRSMRPAVLSRIVSLPDSCQDLLTIAAVLGGPFAVGTLAAAAGRSVIDVLTDLRAAEAAGILTEVDGVLCFRHDLVRAVVYEEMPASVRSTLHLRIGNSLLVAGAGAALVGFHLTRAMALGVERTVPLTDALPGGVPPAWERLTHAEREVVRHVIDGYSNREIGERLFVSPRTVETHLSHVFAKLGVRSRVELTGAVVRSLGARSRPAERSEGWGGARSGRARPVRGGRQD